MKGSGVEAVAEATATAAIRESVGRAIAGVSYLNQRTQQFQFHPGPVFANVLLAEEMSRATPRTQSAFLEAMEEKQVTVDLSHVEV